MSEGGLKQTRHFRCDDCGALEFSITVEPSYPIDAKKALWLEECFSCPNCGGQTEEL